MFNGADFTVGFSVRVFAATTTISRHDAIYLLGIWKVSLTECTFSEQPFTGIQRVAQTLREMVRIQIVKQNFTHGL